MNASAASGGERNGLTPGMCSICFGNSAAVILSILLQLPSVEWREGECQVDQMKRLTHLEDSCSYIHAHML